MILELQSLELRHDKTSVRSWPKAEVQLVYGGHCTFATNEGKDTLSIPASVVFHLLGTDFTFCVIRQIKTESLIAFRAKLCECSHFGDTRARLVSLLPTPQDARLAELLHVYSNPVLMHNPALGKHVFDKSSEVFAGAVKWMGKDIRITLATDERADTGDTLATAKTLLSDIAGWTRKVNDYAAARLLDLKNGHWLEDDEAPVTREGFIARMQLDSISVGPGGEFIFWHLDGDLFFGHYIQICGSLEDGMTDADIPG